MRSQAEDQTDRTTRLPAPVIQASTPCLEPPAWALAQRSLFRLLDEGWRRFAALYTRPDGSLRYAGRLTSRDGADDFLETFFNWPQLYLLGGVRGPAGAQRQALARPGRPADPGSACTVTSSSRPTARPTGSRPRRKPPRCTPTASRPTSCAAYWRASGFGELSEIAHTRADVLARLLPRLAIGPQCTIQGRFLHVRGTLHEYKIHLGSGNILMSPDDSYLCIVPDGRTLGRGTGVTLPFEGDDTLGIIISKAVLLARDDEITEPSIASQIRGE